MTLGPTYLGPPEPSDPPGPADGEGTHERANTYRLLGHLLLEEVRAEMLPELRSFPELAAALPALDAPASEVEARLQKLRVEHHRLFGMNIYPYESVFLSEEATLNTRQTARVEALYREWDVRPPAELRYGAADHLGLEMLAMAHLIEGDRAENQARWLHRHPALWGPILFATVERIGSEPFYPALARLASRFLLEDLERVARPGDDPDELPDPEVGGTPEDAGSGLQELVDWLSTPVRSGILLTRTDLAAMAHRLDLPVGMLAPSVMLKNLLRSAGQFERVPPLLEALTRMMENADRQYAKWETAHPGWEGQASSWRKRTRASLRRLADMTEAAGSGP